MNIFEYFVFSTIYIQHLFSGVHPYTLVVERHTNNTQTMSLLFSKKNDFVACRQHKTSSAFLEGNPLHDGQSLMRNRMWVTHERKGWKFLKNDKRKDKMCMGEIGKDSLTQKRSTSGLNISRSILSCLLRNGKNATGCNYVIGCLFQRPIFLWYFTCVSIFNGTFLLVVMF